MNSNQQADTRPSYTVTAYRLGMLGADDITIDTSKSLDRAIDIARTYWDRRGRKYAVRVMESMSPNIERPIAYFSSVYGETEPRPTTRTDLDRIQNETVCLPTVDLAGPPITDLMSPGWDHEMFTKDEVLHGLNTNGIKELSRAKEMGWTVEQLRDWEREQNG